MTKLEIQREQRRIGVVDDGFWGPISTEAAKKHLRRMMPNPHPFPSQAQVRSDRSIFGKRGREGGYSPPTKKIALPFTIYYGSSPVSYLYPHELCADRLKAVFERLEDTFSAAEREEYKITRYDGLYNPRNVRGGSVASMHAYAIAIDIDAERNGNKTHWPVSSKMPIAVFECFAKEGFLSAGAFWSRDGMHHQATNE